EGANGANGTNGASSSNGTNGASAEDTPEPAAVAADAAQARPPQRQERPDRQERRGRDRTPPTTKIEDLLKEGQEVVVQVVKEPLGTKGARITSHLSLPGRFLVYMP